MRINLQTGGFCCMSCGVSGGDVLAYEIALNGTEFVEAARSLGAWVDDGKEPVRQKPTSLPPRAALQLLHLEANLVAIAACNVAHGIKLTDEDHARLQLAARRIAQISQEFA